MRGPRGRGIGTLSAAALLAAVTGCASTPARLPPGDPLDLVSAETLFQLGVELEPTDSIRSEQYLSAALARGYPEAEVIPVILGVCVRASRFGDALDYAEPYLERHPEDWALRVLVASIHMGLGHPNDAQRHLGVVLEVAPDAPSGHYLMAVIARDSLADPLLARTHFARYLELAPDGEHASEASLELRRTDAAGVPVPAPVRLPSHGEAEAGATGDAGADAAAPVHPVSGTPAGAPATDAATGSSAPSPPSPSP